MTDEAELQLRADGTDATFLPELGMVGISLRHGGSEALVLPGGLDAYRGGHVIGLPLLAPWANRLSGRHYEVAGVDVDLSGVDLHDDGHGLPIHGTMTAQQGWQVAASTDTSARVRFDYGARPDLLRAFPFPHEIVLDLELSDGRLGVATTVRPTGDRPVPVSFGWHPYLALPGSRVETRLRLPVCDHHLLDRRGLPTGHTEPQAAEEQPLGDRSYDDLYALGADRTLALVADDRMVTVAMEDGYAFAQVYSPADAPFGCLEPMTAPTNALVTGDCPLIEPGDEFTARFTVTMSEA
ncbi:MAG: aldose 1-epimerase [Acidimicrobiia bacterium]|nr:aldose 1-epimerase [Acidimicrobiia bacterium]